jgi:simple sugar transport system permease protein
MITDGSTSGFTGGAGYNGIVAALFGSLNPLLTIPASVLFGSLLVGANAMQRVTQVPSALITALNGLVVVFVVSSEIWRRKRQQKRLIVPEEEKTITNEISAEPEENTA